ncbi:MAG: hypothetical protein AAGD17_08595 [Bacteroidota bacterium]
MNTISKSLLLAATFLLSISTFGQKKMDANEMAEYQNNLMKSELNLNSEQLAKVEELNAKYSVKTADLMNKEGSMFGKIGDMKKIKKAKNEELAKILTEEQMEKFEDELEPKIRKTMRKKMSEK